jgi:hypothetical protein
VTAGDRPRGRHVSTESGDGRPVWLLPLIAVAALLVVVLVLALTGGDDEDATAPDAPAPPAPAEDGDPAEPGDDAAATGPQEPAAPSEADPDAGSLSAGDVAVFPLAEPNQDLTDYLDAPVRASRAPVQSVVGGSGFWLGPSPQERVWVRLVPAEGLEQPLEPGTLVQFEGARFVPHDEAFPASVGVAPEAGAEQLAAQRAHVEVPASAVRTAS